MNLREALTFAWNRGNSTGLVENGEEDPRIRDHDVDAALTTLTEQRASRLNRDERVLFEAYFRREFSVCSTSPALDEWLRLDGPDYAYPHVARDFVVWQAAVATLIGGE